MINSRRITRAAAAATVLSMSLVVVPTPGVLTGLVGSAAVAIAATQSAPVTPAGMLADGGSDKFYVQWTANTDSAIGYQVHYEYIGLLGTLLGQDVSITGRQTTFLVVNGSNLLTYKVKVRAVYGTAAAPTYSDWTPEVQVKPTAANLNTPARVAGVAAVAGQEKVSLSWNLPPADSRTAVEIYRDGALLTNKPVGTNAWDDTSVEVGRSYNYSFVAVNGAATSGNRSAVSAVVGATPFDKIAPAVPVDFAGTPGDTTGSFTWRANTEADLDHYELTRGATTISVAKTATSAQVSGLTNAVSYSFALRAVDRNGNKSDPANVSVTPVDSTPPDAPATLSVTAEDSALQTSWSPSTASDAVGYRVFLDGSLVATTNSRTAVAARLNGLINGRSYSVTVKAVDGAGNVSLASPSVTGTPVDKTPPGAPVGVTAEAGDSTVKLSWTANTESDLALYKVLNGSGDVVASINAPSTSVVLHGLVNGTSYTYRIVAVDVAGNTSSASGAVTVTPKDSTPPSQPLGVAVVAGDGQATLSWSANTESDLARYLVLDGSGATVATVTAPTRSVVLSGLANGTSYSYRVVAVDTAGNNSAASASVSVTPKDSTPPSQPVGVAVVAGDGQATLSWSANTESDLARYLVLDGSGATVATVTAPTRSVVLSGLANGTSYSYRVVAVDTAGNNSAASASVSVTPKDLTPPVAPSSATATAGDATALVSWSLSSSTDVTKYEVRDQRGVLRATVAGSLSSVTVTGLVNDQDYAFTVVAIDGAGNASVGVTTAQVRPHEQGLAAPTGVTGVAGDATVSLSWGSVTGAAQYRVTRDGVVVSTVSGTQVTISALTNGQTYTFSVTAVSASGALGAASAGVSLTPRAAAPAGTLPQGSGANSGLAVTRDGRYAIVGTTAQLEASDTDQSYDLYFRDAATGRSTRLDPSSSGTDLNASQVQISNDGRFVSLVTKMSKVTADTNKLPDVYRLDRQTGAWQLASVPAGGKVTTVAGTTLQKTTRVYSTSPAVAASADGNFIFFFSERADLIAGDTNNAVDLFRKDMTSGTVVRVSTDSSGGQLSAGATGPALDVTPDGRFAVFVVKVQGVPAVWRKDLTTGALDLVSGTGSWGNVRSLYSSNFDAHDVSVSDDGRYVGFSSISQELTAGATEYLAYRKDMTAGVISSAGLPGAKDVWERQATVDPTGQYVFFSTTADYASDQDGHTDWYRRDLASPASAPVLVTSDDNGRPGPRFSTAASDSSEFGAIEVLSATSVVVATKQIIAAGDVNGVMDALQKNLANGRVWSLLS